MKQLGNQDAGFIYNETPTTPMHIAGLGIYDQSTAPGGRLGHKDIIRYVQDRIHLTPIFRYKLVEVPLGLDKPYWIEDPDFDIEFHIRHIALPRPGDWRQLCILVSRINARPLDLGRPLWETYVIEGLDNIEGLPKGSFAVLTKLHHSIADGMSAQAAFGALHDLARDATPAPPDKPLMAERPPGNLELISRAIPNMIRRPVRQGRTLYQKAPALIKNAIRLYRGDMKSGTRLRVPTTRFNHYVSPHRVFDGVQFEFADIKFIRNVAGHGTTLNDVVLCVIGGAMQRYLAHHDEAPGESMTAMLPQDVRNHSSRDHIGNLVGGLFADLHTDVADPIMRLQAIHRSTNMAKRFAITMDTASMVQNFMGGFLNPPLGRVLNRAVQRTRLLDRFGSFACNTLITNVPGPNIPLFHAGAQMVTCWGIPPLVDCVGLAHAVFSYCGKTAISVYSCRQMLPDPAFYMQCVRESFAELHDAATRLRNQRIATAVATADIATTNNATTTIATTATATTTPSEPPGQVTVLTRAPASTRKTTIDISIGNDDIVAQKLARRARKADAGIEARPS